MEYYVVVFFDNNNIVVMMIDCLVQYKKMINVDMIIYEGMMINDMNFYDVKLIGGMEVELFVEQVYCVSGFVVEMSDGQILNVYMVVLVYENGGYEVYYYFVGR